MPRIPSDLLERIKQETPLRLLVERSGVVLKVSGENLIGLCCLHEDHEPSLVLTPSRGLWPKKRTRSSSKSRYNFSFRNPPLFLPINTVVSV